MVKLFRDSSLKSLLQKYVFFQELVRIMNNRKKVSNIFVEFSVF